MNVRPKRGRELSMQLVQSLRAAVANMVPDLDAADVTVAALTTAPIGFLAGLVTGAAVGSATITATSEGKKGKAEVEVDPAPTTPAGH